MLAIMGCDELVPIIIMVMGDIAIAAACSPPCVWGGAMLAVIMGNNCISPLGSRPAVLPIMRFGSTITKEVGIVLFCIMLSP